MNEIIDKNKNIDTNNYYFGGFYSISIMYNGGL